MDNEADAAEAGDKDLGVEEEEGEEVPCRFSETPGGYAVQESPSAFTKLAATFLRLQA